MKPATIGGSTRRATLAGTLSLSVPAGRLRKALTTSSAASTSPSAGTNRSNRRAPASVGATLRVVRLSRRRPSRVSSRRTASLSRDGELCEARAASRKPRACTTATNAERSSSSAMIVRFPVQPVPTVRDYRAPMPRPYRGHATRRAAMTDIETAGKFALGDRSVNRLGYGAMQLAGPGVFGPPRDRDAALAVLREAIAMGVNHIDTSDFYGPHVTNQLIREALHPYSGDLTIVTKVGARRGDDASWIPALTPADLTQGVHDNLRNLGVETLDV